MAAVIPAPRPGDQIAPLPSPGPDIQPLVIQDLVERYELGKSRYGTGLKTFNGRSGLVDLYQELADALMYVRQVIEEDKAMLVDAEVEYRSVMTVELVQSAASDASVVSAARVSTQGDQSRLADRDFATGSPEARLIAFLMRNRHGTPFEHTSMTFFVQAPIFVFRELMRHRIACLAGDTKIYFESERGNGHWKTIAEHYNHWHHGIASHRGPHRHLPSVRSAQVRSLDETTLEKRRSPVLDVVQSGVKPVFRVTTSRGFSIVASADHPFYGPAGWAKVKDLSVGDHVYVQGRSSNSDHAPAVPPALRYGIQMWLNTVRSRILARDGAVCAACGEAVVDCRVDHVLPVASHLHLALEESNLQVLCLACDATKTSSEQILARRPSSFHTVTPDVIVSIDATGEQMTYDLILAPPHHNFLADGFMVHNSYNEESGRYRELAPVFYVPTADRKLQQTGKAGRYHFEPGTLDQASLVDAASRRIARIAYSAYQQMLASGVAREVARMVLPLSIYSSAYVTMNARALMNFLSLRTTNESATYPSFPQREIEMVAQGMEDVWITLMPLTHAAFHDAGRVAP